MEHIGAGAEPRPAPGHFGCAGPFTEACQYLTRESRGGWELPA